MANKTVLITGASTGIGNATARYFQQKGWNVGATMRKPEAGAELAKLNQVLVTRLDVTDESSIGAAVEEVIARFGGVDVLVNNAGYGAYGVLEATPTESMRKQFETNVIGLLTMTRAVLPGFRQRGSGVIINISSIGGRITFPFGTLYHASKFAVEGLSDALRFELREIGVRVKLVEPGAIKTEFMSAFQLSNDESLTEYQPLVKKTMEIMGPMMEGGADPEVVAKVIYAAATDESDQLRYPAGDDAVAFMAERSAKDDATFLAEMEARFDK